MTEVAITLTAYHALQKKALPVLQTILHEASRLTKERSSHASEMTRQDLNESLKYIASTTSPPTENASQTVKISYHDYSWLDRQLDPLRFQVIERANAYSGNQKSASGTLECEDVTADMIERAWDDIWSNVVQRSEALLGN